MGPMDSADPHVQIRPYERADAASTLAIFTAAITQTAAADYSPEQVQAWALPGHRDSETWNREMCERHSLVATVNGDVAGFSDVAPDGYVDMMFVSPQHQRQGIAHRLLGEIETEARRLGATELYADVSITARPFFERHGFIVESEQHPVRHGVQLVNFRMRKPLP